MCSSILYIRQTLMFCHLLIEIDYQVITQYHYTLEITQHLVVTMHDVLKHLNKYY